MTDYSVLAYSQVIIIFDIGNIKKILVSLNE